MSANKNINRRKRGIADSLFSPRDPSHKINIFFVLAYQELLFTGKYLGESVQMFSLFRLRSRTVRQVSLFRSAGSEVILFLQNST
jgi:hypothetical protein